MKKLASGFSLIELLVVIAIIGILSSVIYANLGQGSAQGRDLERQSNLREVQAALELYKNEHGRYPAACNGAAGWSSTETGWSGQTGTTFGCTSGSQYIVGLVPKYIPALPVDPKLNGNNSGYVYAVNADGTVYKFMAKRTVESELVDYKHAFKSCDSTSNNKGMCDAVASNFNNAPPHCAETNANFRSSYAVWGGYAYVAPTLAAAPGLINNRTEDIICRW
ncbi:type II secretion system protein [Candidatus Kaiserbacteria bacterium]|nr:type II secretion system protein [Candidatus Kaiserbacteria bacterium]MCA9359154.1 type II secretion system protein [Candidatus Kaiserbacteria bacterium]